MTTYDEKTYGGELVVHYESHEYCFTGAKVKNVKSATSGDDGYNDEITDPVGLPLKDNAGTWELVEAGNENTIEGLIVAGPTLEALAPNASSTNTYLILKRAPAVINQDSISVNDPYGDAYTQADIRTALAALNFELRTNPTKTTTQTE